MAGGQAPGMQTPPLTGVTAVRPGLWSLGGARRRQGRAASRASVHTLASPWPLAAWVSASASGVHQLCPPRRQVAGLV